MDVKFFLFTKFNIVLSYSKEKEYDVESDENYLDYRFSIFEKYTLPSVMSSDMQDFVWFILFSSRIPEKYKDRINKYVELYKNINPLYIDSDISIDLKELEKTLKKEVLAYKTDYYLLSRLDNDDVISSKYISTLYEYALSLEDCELPVAIRPINGFQYNTKKKILCKYYNPVNQFLTIFCSMDRIIIPLFIRHTKVGDTISDVRNITEKPLWMEVINNENVYNRSIYKPQNVVNDINALNDFCVKDDLRIGRPFLTFSFSVVNYFRMIYHSGIGKMKYICGRVR